MYTHVYSCIDTHTYIQTNIHTYIHTYIQLKIRKKLKAVSERLEKMSEKEGITTNKVDLKNKTFQNEINSRSILVYEKLEKCNLYSNK